MQRFLAILVCVISGLVFAAEWEPEIRLTNNNYSDYSYWSTQRRVVVDPQDRIHVAWYVMNSGLGTYRFQIYYKRYEPGSGWTNDTMISFDLYNQNLNSKHVSLACDSMGTIYAVWCSGPDDVTDEYIYLKTWSPNNGWDENSRLLSVSGPNVVKECATVSVTPEGHIHVVWLEGTNIIYRERVDTCWRAPVVVEGGSNYKAYPAVAGGPDNKVHLVWYGREGTSGYYDVFYKVRTDTVWGQTENVSQGERHQMYPSIAVNPVTGNPHIFWQCYGASDLVRRAVHRWRSPAGWQPTDTVSERNDTLDQEPGQIVFTPDGLGHAVWSGKSKSWPNITQIRYAERQPDGTWSAPVNITDTVNTKERPSIASGNGTAPNNIHAVWTDYRDGNAEIYYARARPSPGIGEIKSQKLEFKQIITVIRGMLYLPEGTKGNPVSGVLFDALGQKVARLGPGYNDVRPLQSGVYFLRIFSEGKVTDSRKVIIAE
ncbi:MAG: T9SS type A sorting domain-containing protein [candidate division WOR-3 bacterium]